MFFRTAFAVLVVFAAVPLFERLPKKWKSSKHFQQLLDQLDHDGCKETVVQLHKDMIQLLRNWIQWHKDQIKELSPVQVQFVPVAVPKVPTSAADEALFRELNKIEPLDLKKTSFKNI